VVMRVGEARWLPVRGCLVRGKMRRAGRQPQDLQYLAEKRMPWGRLKFR
jgi:hypothetical protein